MLLLPLAFHLFYSLALSLRPPLSLHSLLLSLELLWSLSVQAFNLTIGIRFAVSPFSLSRLVSFWMLLRRVQARQTGKGSLFVECKKHLLVPSLFLPLSQPLRALPLTQKDKNTLHFISFRFVLFRFVSLPLHILLLFACADPVANLTKGQRTEFPGHL